MKGLFKMTEIDRSGAAENTLKVFDELSELQKEFCKHSEYSDEIEYAQRVLDKMLPLRDCEASARMVGRMWIERIKNLLGIDA